MVAEPPREGPRRPNHNDRNDPAALANADGASAPAVVSATPAAPPSTISPTEISGTAPPAVEAVGFVKRYGKVEAVRGLDLSVRRGELFGLIGPDGAGKSSLLKAVAGVLSYEGGEVRVFGRPVTSEAGAEEAKAHLGFMPQGLGRNLYGDLSIEENIDFFAKLRLVPADVLKARKERLLAMTRLDRFRARPMKQLSGGMKQKLGLVCTLIHEPRLILLDEPTTGVDPVSRRDFWTILHEILAEGGVTAIISTAYMDEASRFDRVALLHLGRALAIGPARDVTAATPGVVLRIRPEAIRPVAIRPGGQPSGAACSEPSAPPPPSAASTSIRGGEASPVAFDSSPSSAPSTPAGSSSASPSFASPDGPDPLELLGAHYASVRGLGREVRVFVPRPRGPVAPAPSPSIMSGADAAEVGAMGTAAGSTSERAAAEAELRALLGPAGLNFTVTGREEPDLEDVFVCRVDKREGPGGRSAGEIVDLGGWERPAETATTNDAGAADKTAGAAGRSSFFGSFSPVDAAAMADSATPAASATAGNKRNAANPVEAAGPEADASRLAISARELVRDFGKFRAVDHVSFSVRPGEIFGLLGANGAGKTTVIKMLTGILPPTGGAGSVAGADMLRGGRIIKERIGYMSQAFSLYSDLTVLENLRLYAGVYGLPRALAAERVAWAVRLSGLSGRENAQAGSLPMGLSQRLALSCALLHRPRILFLDEPTSGVDPLGRRLFWDILRHLSRRAGVAVLITTHYMSEAEYCDHLALMYAGRVVADATPTAMKDALLAEAGPMLEVRADDPHRAVVALSAAGYADAALHGSSVHVQAGPGDAAERGRAVAGALSAAGVAMTSVVEARLSMEDVFVHRVLALEAADRAAASAKGAAA